MRGEIAAERETRTRGIQRKAQGWPGGVLGGVQVAELEGHRSRSALILVHKGEGRRRRFEQQMNPSGVNRLRKRMLSQRECERPVNWITACAGPAGEFIPVPDFSYQCSRGTRLE